MAKNGPSWSSVAIAGNSTWLTNLEQLSHLPCLYGSWLYSTYNTKRWEEHADKIVAPSKREGIDSHCLWF